MRNTRFAFMSAFLLMCLAGNAQSKKETAIKEIQEAEKSFEAMAAAKSIQQAFVYFAAEDAIIKRGNDSLITGKAGIGNFYSKDVYKTAVVNWSPDFTDASEAGDMGYTIGKYTWKMKDEKGDVKEYKGVFHTVWKRQADGSWKYVWD